MKIRDGLLPLGGDAAETVRTNTNDYIERIQSFKDYAASSSDGCGIYSNSFGFVQGTCELGERLSTKACRPSELAKTYKMEVETYTPAQPGSGKRKRQNQGSVCSNRASISDYTPAASTSAATPSSLAVSGLLSRFQTTNWTTLWRSSVPKGDWYGSLGLHYRPFRCCIVVFSQLFLGEPREDAP